MYTLQWHHLFFRLLAVCLSLIIMTMIQIGKANLILKMIGCMLSPVGYVLDHMQNYIVQHQQIGIFGETETFFITIAVLGFEVCFGMDIMDIKVHAPVLRPITSTFNFTPQVMGLVDLRSLFLVVMSGGFFTLFADCIQKILEKKVRSISVSIWFTKV